MECGTCRRMSSIHRIEVGEGDLYKPLVINFWHMKYASLILLLTVSTALMGQAPLPTEDYEAYKERLHYTEVEGGKLAYVDEGEGPAILLVHGVPTSSWLYVRMVNELVASGHRVIAPDLLGYGASDKPDGYEVYHQKRQGARLLQLMEHLEIESWTHVCHDVGGLFTWEMLRMAPEKVERLVVLNTIMYTEGFNPPMRFKKSGWAKFYTWLYKSKWGSKMMMKATFNNGLSKQTKLSKQRLRGFYLPMQEGGNKAIYQFFTQTCHLMPDYTGLFDSLDVPIKVIWGAKDPMLKWEPQKDLVMKAMNLKEEDVYTLADGVHFIQEEEFESISQHIARFISE